MHDCYITWKLNGGVSVSSVTHGRLPFISISAIGL